MSDTQRQLELLLEIDRISDAAGDESRLTLQLVACVAEAVDADLAAFSLPDHDQQGEWKLQAVTDRGELLQDLPLGRVSELVAQATEDVQGDDTSAHFVPQKEIRKQLDAAKGLPPVFLLAVPQMLDAEILGVLVVARMSSDFTEAEVELLHIATTRMDSALRHTRTLQQLAQETLALRTILNVDRIRDTSASMDEMLDRALTELTKVIPAESGFIMLYDRRGNRLELRALSGGHFEGMDASLKELYEVADASIQSGKLAHLQGDGTVIRSMLGVPLILNERVIGVLGVLNRMRGRDFTQDDRQLLEVIASQMDTAIFERLETQRLREVFGRRVGGKVMQRLLQISDRDLLVGERVELSVLFSDIRDFTQMSEKLDPQVLEDMINMHFEAMVNVLMRYEGTLDKFTGDGVMAFFNVPERQPDHALRATRAALAMHAAHEAVMAEWQAKDYPVCPIGIGLVSGEVLVGNFGSPEHAEFTAIGPNVNLAARLCAEAEGGETWVDEKTFQLLAAYVEAQELPPHRFKGFSQALKAWNVSGLKEE